MWPVTGALCIKGSEILTVLVKGSSTVKGEE